MVKTILILFAASAGSLATLLAQKAYSFEIGPTTYILLASIASSFFSYLASRRAAAAEAKSTATETKVLEVVKHVELAAVDRTAATAEVKHITALVNSSNAQLATVAVKKDDEIRAKDRELQEVKAELAGLKMAATALAAAQTITAAQPTAPIQPTKTVGPSQ